MPVSFVDVEAYALSIAVSTSWAFLRTQHGGRPKHLDALRVVLQRHSIPKKNYVLHPLSLAHAVRDVLPQRDAVLRKLETRLREPAVDPLNLFRDPCGIPSACLERVHRDLKCLISKSVFKRPEQLVDWLVSQSYCSTLVHVHDVIMGLVELGALVVDNDRTVWYIDAMADWKGDVALFLPYLKPWLLECPPSPSDIPIAHMRVSRSLKSTPSSFRELRGRKEGRKERRTERCRQVQSQVRSRSRSLRHYPVAMQTGVS